jgi:hypothetical protein
MRITESRLRSIIRSVILESENRSYYLNESILSQAKKSLKNAVANLKNINLSDHEKHSDDYPYYIENTGGIKSDKALELCKKYFDFAKENNFNKNTKGKYNCIKWLKKTIKNNSEGSNKDETYAFFIERLYLKIFEVLLEKDLINTESISHNTGVENWRWSDEISYSRDGSKNASF